MARRVNFSVDNLWVGQMTGPGSTPQIVTSGKKFYVDSNNGQSGRSGATHVTLTAALAQCVAGRGDVIYVMAGHAETLTAALTVSKTGVTIVGCGNGANRPTFTINASIPGFNMTGANVKVYNLRIIAGASAVMGTRLIRIAADNVKFIGCQIETVSAVATGLVKPYHTVVCVSGDQCSFEDCTFKAAIAPGAAGGVTGVKPQACILNIGGTKFLVKGCRFNDMGSDKSYRWKAVIEGGKLTADTTVQECTFVCRGIATRTRSAAASGIMSTIDCRAISPSSNTSVGALYTPTYQYIIESYNVAAVNKVGVVAVTT